MKPQTKSAIPLSEAALPRIFAGLFGALLGLSLLKFGNPPIFEQYVTTPNNIYEFVFVSPWPIRWGYSLLTLVAVLGLLVARWNAGAPRWLLALPLVWLGWQVLATVRSVDAQASNPTLMHLAACVVCFYLGLFSLSRVRCLSWFWLTLVVAFLLVLGLGWEQHFGGLERTRQYFRLYIYPEAEGVTPEYLKKLASDRIFSTLFYSNTLAGALLLLLPTTLGVMAHARDRFTRSARFFLVAVTGLGGLSCLYWSGSKGGWLLMLLLGLIALLRLNFAKRLKMALVTALLLVGLSGFFWKYSGFFQKGAPSVGARLDYWQAAVRTAITHPLFGTGPGTFAIPYRKIKRPESEPSKLAHNDYLEQASDSGLPGFLAYLAFIVGALAWSAPHTHRTCQGPTHSQPASKPTAPPSLTTPPLPTMDWEAFFIWLGLLGWALQGLMEFGLYIPALAWPAFSLMGWFLGRPGGRNTIDIPPVPL
jgi:O-antigen ligase